MRTLRLPPSARWPSSLVQTILIFASLWILFFLLSSSFPYIKNGSSIVFGAKLRFESAGQVFPADANVARLIIFGNSKILAGFLPAEFDRLASATRLSISSFNSGFPGSDLLLPPLKAMCDRGQAPDILLLTLPVPAGPPQRTLFHFIQDDHAVVERFFPFRDLARDLTSFLLSAPQYGGIAAFYREAKKHETSVIDDRGYYLITEQDRYAGGRLPDDFHLASDQPGVVISRGALSRSSEVQELQQIISSHHIQCYFVPTYLRIGEAATPPARNQPFAGSVERLTSCTVLGPDYFLYPNRLFADQTHLNRTGAQLYTEAVFDLLQQKLASRHSQ